MKQIFRLVHTEARKNALEAVRTAQDGLTVTIAPSTRTLDQNALIHPVCRAVQFHLESHGSTKRSEDWWRNYFVAKYAGQEVVPDGEGGFIVVNKCKGTSSMNKAEASDFIEWLYAYGSEIGIDWSKAA